MTFDTDRQTLSDLDIFPKESGIKSVFDYYNRTQTNGGKDLLLSLMGSPLTDLNEIKSRICSIQFLLDNNFQCEFKSSVFFISTHIVEVGKELEKSEKICFKCFESKLQNEQPIYSYKLQDGISSERLGLTILKNERILEMIDEIAENEI